MRFRHRVSLSLFRDGEGGSVLLDVLVVVVAVGDVGVVVIIVFGVALALDLEALLGMGLRRQHRADIVEGVRLVVELEILLQFSLLANQRALGVGPQVGDLGSGRERDLAVVGRDPGRSRG